MREHSWRIHREDIREGPIVQSISEGNIVKEQSCRALWAFVKEQSCKIDRKDIRAGQIVKEHSRRALVKVTS